VVSSLARTDALTKLLIEKGLITEAEFMQKLSAERVVYQAMLRKMSNTKWQSHVNGSATRPRLEDSLRETSRSRSSSRPPFA